MTIIINLEMSSLNSCNDEIITDRFHSTNLVGIRGALAQNNVSRTNKSHYYSFNYGREKLRTITRGREITYKLNRFASTLAKYISIQLSLFMLFIVFMLIKGNTLCCSKVHSIRLHLTISMRKIEFKTRVLH